MKTTKELDWWRGKGGDLYAQRNPVTDEIATQRASSLLKILYGYEIDSVLEVGCGPGANILALERSLPNVKIWAVEPNDSMLGTLLSFNLHGLYRDIRFYLNDDFVKGNGKFDLVMTAGVLIHVNPEDLSRLMHEVVSLSKKYVLAIEYFAPECVSMDHESGYPIWKNNFGSLYEGLGLTMESYGFLRKETDGFDNCVWWLLRRNKKERE